MATRRMNTVIEHLRRVALAQDRAGMTDGQLLEAFIADKDDEAFEALLHRHGPMVMGVCFRILRNHHDSEDGFQATFLVLARKASSVRPRQHLANWLHGVAYRTALKAKAMRTKTQLRESQVAQVPEPEAVQEDNWTDLRPILDEELNRLPESYRLAILLCDLEGKSIKEATQQLGWPQGTLAGRLARARKMLAKRLTQRGVVLSGGALAVVLAEKAASACVPVSLAVSTTKAAVAVAAGQAAAPSLVSAKVAALMEGVVKGMLLTKLKTVTVVLLALCVVAFGGGLLEHQWATGQQSKAQKEDAKPANRRTELPASGQSLKVRADAIGDALPPGALLRLGTIRWRAGTVVWHSGSAMSPDGRSLFVGNDPGGICVIDLDSGMRLRPLRGHEGEVRVLAVSNNGKLLASASQDKAYLWDIESGKQLRPHKLRAVSVMAFSPDGKKLITGGDDQERSVRVLDIASGKEELRMLYHQRRLTFVGCRPNNKTLVSVSSDNDVRVTDLSTGKAIHTFSERDGDETIAALSPDGKTLAVADGSFQLRLIDVAAGTQRQIVKQGKQRISVLVFSPDCKSLVAWGGKHCQVYDVVTGKATRQLPGVHAPRYFTPDGRYLVSPGSVIRVWEFESGNELHPPEGAQDFVDSLSFAPDGKMIASSSQHDSEVIHLWDAVSGKLKAALRGHADYIRAVQFAPDGRLISAGGDSTLRAWDVGTEKEVFQFKLHNPRAGEKPLQVVAMRVSNDGRTLAAAAIGFELPESARLFAWNLANGKLLATRELAGFGSDWRPGFSTDDKAFLAREGKDLVLRDLVTGKEKLRLQPAPQPGGEGVVDPNVLQPPFTFSPDGRVVAVRGSRQGKTGPRRWVDHHSIVLFDLATGKEMHRIPVDTWQACAAFSPDSKRLAAAVGPRVRIWDTATGKRLWESPELDTRLTALAFSPDGRRLATALGNTTTLVWDAGSIK